jgi:hypothetical protein
MRKVFYCSAMIISLVFCFRVQADEGINMNEVRELAKLSVDTILENSPVDTFTMENYWKNVHGRNTPLVVFFYSNFDGPSQRLATLIRYIAPHYNTKLSFGRVKVLEKGKPNKVTSDRLASMYSLDKTPGILFYDNVGTDMVLEDEDYIDADFKEFRTPRMLLWKTYYTAVRKELDQLLAD